MSSVILHFKHNWRKELMDNNYVVLEKIDEGSFGEVYTTYKQNDTMVYAVKAIKANGLVTDDEYILAEIRSLLQLRHPNIIIMHDLVLSETFACILMEYATQGNMEKHTLQHHPLREQFLMTSFRQVSSAVEFCHSKFIAHKDINPSNVLIFNDQCVKLADFGLAVKCHDASGCRVLCDDYLGQNPYLAPEVLGRVPHNAMLADVWSLGCLLYFMLCGKPTFEGSAANILEKQPKGMKLPKKLLTDSPNFSYAIYKVIKHLCNIDPKFRISSQETVEVWDDFVDRRK